MAHRSIDKSKPSPWWITTCTIHYVFSFHFVRDLLFGSSTLTIQALLTSRTHFRHPHPCKIQIDRNWYSRGWNIHVKMKNERSTYLWPCNFWQDKNISFAWLLILSLSSLISFFSFSRSMIVSTSFGATNQKFIHQITNRGEAYSILRTFFGKSNPCMLQHPDYLILQFWC